MLNIWQGTFKKLKHDRINYQENIYYQSQFISQTYLQNTDT